MPRKPSKSAILPMKTDPPAGLGKGRDGAARLVDTDRQGGGGSGGGRPKTDIAEIIKEQRWHIEWRKNFIRWRWLLDSYEGGERYKDATYGPDRRGLPARNLLRHKREYPDPQMFPTGYQGFAGFTGGVADGILQGANVGPLPGQLGAHPNATAYDDDYELRRAGTPVPEFVGECIEIHTSKLYDQEVSRDGPDDLIEWWKDVDGQGTPIDDWIKETFSPLQLAIGFLDVCFDHPAVPAGEDVKTRADELRLGLDQCIVSYILPENIVWWRYRTNTKEYEELLVREYTDPADRNDIGKDGKPIDPEKEDSDESKDWCRSYVRYRHWTATGSRLYDYDGNPMGKEITYAYGQPPVRRIISKERHRTPHVGKSRYEEIASIQMAFYNNDSEEMLSCTLHAHPFLSGPEDFCKADNTLSVGPGYILPMKKNPETGAYQEWGFVSPPSDPTESLRARKQNLMDRKDVLACLSKPAGAVGNKGSTVSQSGISKQLDHVTGHQLLTGLAKSLAKAERIIAEYALMVYRNQRPTRKECEEIVIGYPAKFELFSAAELLDNLTKFQAVLMGAGGAPIVETEALQDAARLIAEGRTDKEYEAMDKELELAIAAKSQIVEAHGELKGAEIESRQNALETVGDGDRAGGADPYGQSGSTLVGTGYASVG